MVTSTSSMQLAPDLQVQPSARAEPVLHAHRLQLE